ncbi:MAG: DUF1844 domain-containing protein [Polyangiaceae bacterium]
MTQPRTGAGPSQEEFPRIDFSTFVLSLSHSALMHLGEAPHPETHQQTENLALARQTIDLIGMLEEKTKGNLSGDEERLIAQILFDLRMRFVEHSKKSAP